MKRLTKIVCTMGPAIDNPETIKKIANLDVKIIRFNFSHQTQQTHKEKIELVRRVYKEVNKDIAILLDTKGPEIRCGEFVNDYQDFNAGDIVKISKKEVLGTKEMFHIQCPELFDDIKVNDYILIDDGKQKITILENNKDILVGKIEVTAPIKTRKGCNVPGVKLTMPFLSEKDKSDIKFGCDIEVDYIAASFVRRKEDVLAIRELLDKYNNKNINIIAKIENKEGFDNIREILEVADGVMVARGDLGVEIETQFVPIYQKQIIKIANQYGKPVITATHMLESMITNHRPTRAEASDVANAVLDGSDAVMLSGETAIGTYPIETITIMSTICNASEQIIPYAQKLEQSKKTNKQTIQDAIGIAISDATLNCDISAIIVFTQGGTTAKRISKFRPSVPIIAVTFDRNTVASLQTYWGVEPVFSTIRNELINDDELASKIAIEYGFKPGELIIISAGYPTGEGSANMMKIVEIK